MNLRKITLRYMGWCPGVKSAARFIPDQNIPPSKVILVFFIIASIMAGSYVISIQALSAQNYPSRVIAVTRNSRPVIVINGDRLYALAEVETYFSAGDHLGGKPHRSKVFLIEFSAEGEIVSSKPIIDIDRKFLGTLDAIVTSTGEWYMVYRYYGVNPAGGADRSDLLLKHSVDGENWSEPIVIAENIGTYWENMPKEQRLKVRLIEEAQIIEDGEGRIHLIFSDVEHRCYQRSKTSTGWSEIKEILFDTDQPYLFMDKDNKIGIIGPEESPEQFEELNGILYSHLLPDGSVEDPVFIKDQNNALRGYFARMVYNPKDDGYLLSYRVLSPIEDHAVLRSVNMETWKFSKGLINTWETTIDVLPDGRYILMYVEDWTLYTITSEDGVNWSAPVKNSIIDEQALYIAGQSQRTTIATVITIITTITTIVVMKKGLKIF
jgi:hypothetical protein